MIHASSVSVSARFASIGSSKHLVLNQIPAFVPPVTQPHLNIAAWQYEGEATIVRDDIGSKGLHDVARSYARTCRPILAALHGMVTAVLIPFEQGL
jgi:hypothetical protein